MTEWAALLESTAPAILLRGSTLAYPLVNAGHLLGVALLVGAIVPLDLRLIGLWPSVPRVPLMRLLPRVAAAGLGIALFCGALLFSTRATEYVASDLFAAKMSFVFIGIINALGSQWAIQRKPLPDKLPPGIRAAAAVSLCAWLGALILGRLVGYF